MANPEYLEILKQGVEVWNKWRQNHPEIRPDFMNADLSYASFNYADFNNAVLIRAGFNNTALIKADLSHADLIKADLSYTNLSYADLSRADLTYASLNHTILDDTKFKETLLGYTTFTNTDLRGAVGLETMKHYFPSDVGINTIYLSEGQIPEVFLRGCGVPDEFITYMHSLVAHPIQFYSCFISYSSKNQDFAERLYSDLQNRGVRCWYAPEDIKIGDRFRIRIDESIRVHDKLLLVLSENSVSSQWVEKEVETAMEREGEQNKTILFPVRLDDAVNEIKTGWPADVRRTRHIGDFTHWKTHDSYQEAFDRLLRDLKAE